MKLNTKLVSFEEIGLIVSVLTGVIAPVGFMFLVRHVRQGDSTKNSTAKAIFNIDTMKQEVIEIKQIIHELKERTDQMYSDLKLHHYRLGKLDNNHQVMGSSQ